MCEKPLFVLEKAFHTALVAGLTHQSNLLASNMTTPRQTSILYDIKNAEAFYSDNE